MLSLNKNIICSDEMFILNMNSITYSIIVSLQLSYNVRYDMISYTRFFETVTVI